MKVLHTLVSVVALGSSVAFADDCATMLNNLADATATTGTHYQTYKALNTTLATNRKDGKYVSYALGDLLRGEGNINLPGRPPVHFKNLTGDLSQQFSDRVINIAPVCQPGTFCIPENQNFSSRAQDILGLTINMSGLMSFTLKSWGNGKFNVQGTCSNNMLYGMLNETFYVLSFKLVDRSGAPR